MVVLVIRDRPQDKEIQIMRAKQQNPHFVIRIFPLIPDRYGEEEGQKGHGKEGELEFPGPLYPFAISDICHRETYQEDGVGGDNHIGKAVCHTVCQNDTGGGEAEALTDGEDDGHNEHDFCRCRADKQLQEQNQYIDEDNAKELALAF